MAPYVRASAYCLLLCVPRRQASFVGAWSVNQARALSHGAGRLEGYLSVRVALCATANAKDACLMALRTLIPPMKASAAAAELFICHYVAFCSFVLRRLISLGWHPSPALLLVCNCPADPIPPYPAQQSKVVLLYSQILQQHQQIGRPMFRASSLKLIAPGSISSRVSLGCSCQHSLC